MALTWVVWVLVWNGANEVKGMKEMIEKNAQKEETASIVAALDISQEIAESPAKMEDEEWDPNHLTDVEGEGRTLDQKAEGEEADQMTEEEIEEADQRTEEEIDTEDEKDAVVVPGNEEIEISLTEEKNVKTGEDLQVVGIKVKVKIMVL